jgi:quercetin dioxygenase-like cupin family protein
MRFSTIDFHRLVPDILDMPDPFVLRSSSETAIDTFDWGELHWYASGPLHNASGVTVGRCILKPGCANPIHYHPNCEEVLHVLSGTIEHYVEGRDWFEMRAGATITIAANIRHGARNIGAEPAHLLICFSSADRQTVGESLQP